MVRQPCDRRPNRFCRFVTTIKTRGSKCNSQTSCIQKIPKPENRSKFKHFFSEQYVLNPRGKCSPVLRYSCSQLATIVGEFLRVPVGPFGKDSRTRWCGARTIGRQGKHAKHNARNGRHSISASVAEVDKSGCIAATYDTLDAGTGAGVKHDIRVRTVRSPTENKNAASLFNITSFAHTRRRWSSRKTKKKIELI